MVHPVGETLILPASDPFFYFDFALLPRHFSLSTSVAVLILVLSSPGCINSWDGEPFVLHVESMAISADDTEGTSSSRIEEVWVYSSTDVLGAFPLPADIPLSPDALGSNPELTLSAGIRANAISSTRQPYPFYDAYSYLPNIEFGGRDTLNLVLGYTDLAQVIVAEDFETSNRFEESSTSTATIGRTENPNWVLEGDASGLIHLTSTEAVLTSNTNEQQFNLTTSGPVWLELDYACDQPFWLGLKVANSETAQRYPILLLKSTDLNPNKIYLDLGPMVRSTPDATYYEILLDAIYDGTQDTTTVIVDNFKLVRYP
jgi:hypothetical protein